MVENSLNKASPAQTSMNMSENLTSELWLKIDQLHLKYLQSEDTPAKLDIRKKLEGEQFVKLWRVQWQWQCCL